MLFLRTVGQMLAQYDWFKKTLALNVNKSVSSSLLGVARLYLIIIAIMLLAACVSQLIKHLNSAPKVP